MLLSDACEKLKSNVSVLSISGKKNRCGCVLQELRGKKTAVGMSPHLSEKWERGVLMDVPLKKEDRTEE